MLFLYLLAALSPVSLAGHPNTQVGDTLGGVVQQIDWLNQQCKRCIYRDTDSAFHYCGQALDLVRTGGETHQAAETYHNLGVVYRVKGNYEKALENYFLSLSLAEDIDDNHFIPANLNAIGVVFKKREDLGKALNYFRKAHEILAKTGNPNGLGATLNNMGEVLAKMGKHSQGLGYFRQSLRIRQQVDDPIGVVKSTNNIASAHADLGLADSARMGFNNALARAAPIEYTLGMATAHLGLSKVEIASKRYWTSINHARQAIALSRLAGAKHKKLLGLALLRDAYEALGDYRTAFARQRQYQQLKDSLFNAAKAREIDHLQLVREEAENKALKKSLEVQQMEIKEQKFRLLAVCAGLGFALVAALLMARLYLLKRTANKALIQQQDQTIAKNTALALLNEEVTVQNQAINTQKQELEQLNELKNRMISVISHDVRTPLSGLYSMIDLVNFSMMGEEEFKQFMPKLHHQVSQVLDFVNSVLFWARGQLNQESIARRTVNIHELIDNNINLLRYQIEEKKIEVNDFSSDHDLVFVDFEMVNLVVKNLLTNALKFTGAHGKVTFSTEQADGLLRVNVSDTGVGMDEQQLGKIFSLEYNKSSLGTSGERGTGLGLTFCKDFVEKNGGEIWATSTKWEGSTFSFTLPLNQN